MIIWHIVLKKPEFFYNNFNQLLLITIQYKFMRLCLYPYDIINRIQSEHIYDIYYKWCTLNLNSPYVNGKGFRNFQTFHLTNGKICLFSPDLFHFERDNDCGKKDDLLKK